MEKVINLLNKYDHGKIKSITSLNSGHICDNYKVITRDNIFVLRIRPDYFGKKNMENDHRFLTFLYNNGFPVPEIIPNKNGETIGLTSDNQLFELESYIYHDQDLTSYSYQQISNKLARFLGEFHRISSQYEQEIIKPPYINQIPVGFFDKYFDGPLDKGLKRYREAARKADGDMKRELNQIIERLEYKLREVRRQLEINLPVLPGLVNHNDFYGNNILLKDEEIVGLIDFDLCSTGPYYIDLIELLHGSIIWQDEEMPYWGLPADGNLRRKKGRQDLQAYFEAGLDFNFDEKLLRELLKVKIISLAWYPAFDMVETVEERLEVARRLEKVIINIDRMGSLV